MMSYFKILAVVALMLFVMPCALGAEHEEENSSGLYDETTAGLFKDIEIGLKEFILAIVSIFALYSIVAIIIGWFGHNKTLFKSGVSGCGVIILAAVVYFLAINGFNYFVENYW